MSLEILIWVALAVLLIMGNPFSSPSAWPPSLCCF